MSELTNLFRSRDTSGSPGQMYTHGVTPLKAALLFREPPNAEGNRQPDHDHVHKQPLNHVMKLIRAPGVKRGERQNDITHYQFTRDAIEQAAHQRVLRQKNQCATGRVVNSRR